jgi:pilus assembly protein CpaB
MRAVTIHADPASSFGGLLRPGDRVDVLLTVERADQRTTSSILQNVLVLATGRDTGGPRTGEEGAAPRVSQITLAVNPDQSQVLALAESQGTLTLALRNPEDITIIEGQASKTTRDLLPAPR